MIKARHHNGFAIAIAWPDTYCKQAGSWYDSITRWLRINNNNYYKAGHAALVLVDSNDGKCHYFDFGRYHTPFHHGRVRSAETDDDLSITMIAKLSDDDSRLDNFKDILMELQQNSVCHGEGELQSSYCKIDFSKAFTKANQMQNDSPIPYGPFLYKGSNCSRFVNTVILAGNPNWKCRFKLNYMVPFTPMPLNNVNSLNNKLIIPKLLKGEPFCPISKLDNVLLKSTLKQPERNPLIPEKAQWLSGEGAGSWFMCNFEKTLLKVIRYSPEGIVECTGLYQNIDGAILNIDLSYKIDYPSNCKSIYLKNGIEEICFERVFI